MAQRLSARAAPIAALLLRRVSLLVILLALTFLAVDVLPGDAARSTMDPSASEEDVAARRAELGLDQPVALRFLHWIGGVIPGDQILTAHSLTTLTF